LFVRADAEVTQVEQPIVPLVVKGPPVIGVLVPTLVTDPTAVLQPNAFVVPPVHVSALPPVLQLEIAVNNRFTMFENATVGVLQ
jgi:hypothetical protein